MQSNLMLLVLYCGLFAAAFSTAALADYPRADLLIEPAALAQPDSANTFVILDARERAKYDAEHVPNARWVDIADWSKGFGDGDDLAGWTKRLAAVGLDTKSKVIVYDHNSSKDAARIWWILRYWGVDDVRLLNGGWRAWQAAQLPSDDRPPRPFAATEPKLQPLPQRLATKDKILAALPEAKLQIVDARSETEFCGTEASTNKHAGAIPGAKNLEWSDLLDPHTQRFKDAAELSRLFTAAGIDLSQPTATHCQSGGRSSVMVFGMELMGATDVSNYYRSWSEWGNADNTPIVPGKPRPATNPLPTVPPAGN